MCEECWHDAGMQVMLSGGSKADVYERLVKERQDDAEHVARNTPRCDHGETAPHLYKATSASGWFYDAQCLGPGGARDPREAQ